MTRIFMIRLIAVLLLLPVVASAQSPQQCTAFTPEISCDVTTGLPVVTLTNTAPGFNPNQIKITPLTPGISLRAAPRDPLKLHILGASAGQSLTLNLSAVAKGGGASPDLDKCCMGEVNVTIPAGFTCDKPRDLSLSTTCTIQPAGTGVLDATCKIDLHYQGPPPSISAPLVLENLLTNADISLTSSVLSSDNWTCPEPAAGEALTCQIDASADPSINWDSFDSALIFNMNTRDTFETCATATGADQTAKACWSTELPILQISKTAPESCLAGAACVFSLKVTNPSEHAYDGPFSLQDQFRRTSPATPGLGEFSAITPPLCDISDLNSGLCTGTVSIAAGGSQSFDIEWTPPEFSGQSFEAGIDVVNCASAASLAGDAMGDADPLDGIEGLACAQTHVIAASLGLPRGAPKDALPDAPIDAPVVANQGMAQLSLEKTLTSDCKVNVSAQTYSCPFQISLTNIGEAAYSGPLAIIDNFQGTSVQEFQLNGADIACDLAETTASCVAPQFDLAAGETSSLDIGMTLMGLVKGGSFDNCASIGLSDDSTAQAKFVQRYLLEQGEAIGKADGKIGPKTAAAIFALREKLGLSGEGGVDFDLIDTLMPANVDGPAEPSCVTTDLPPMPPPPLTCDRATAVKQDGACACRFDRMVKSSKSACVCTKGLNFVAGKGCIKPKAKVKKTPTGSTTTTKPKEAPELRICPNGLPEIPGIGCVTIEFGKKEEAVDDAQTCDRLSKRSCP